jgi:hypothetical protein
MALSHAARFMREPTNERKRPATNYFRREQLAHLRSDLPKSALNGSAIVAFTRHNHLLERYIVSSYMGYRARSPGTSLTNAISVWPNHNYLRTR